MDQKIDFKDLHKPGIWERERERSSERVKLESPAFMLSSLVKLKKKLAEELAEQLPL